LDFEINVIPHEKIPSKVVYKMSPIEQEELRRQLDELIARGFKSRASLPMDHLFRQEEGWQTPDVCGL
jgi:hypothetical protein